MPQAAASISATPAPPGRDAACGAGPPAPLGRRAGYSIPQARYLLLRRTWVNALTPWRDPGMLRRNEALAQLLDQGADQELLAEALRRSCLIPSRSSSWSWMRVAIRAPGAPGWTLVETGSGGNPTGRRVEGLHESLMETDPNGIDADDFW